MKYRGRRFSLSLFLPKGCEHFRLSHCRSFAVPSRACAALVTVCSGLESVCKRLQSVHKLENKVMKAVGAIAHYQKQQQDLADNFVRLSNKYQELKTSFHTVRAGHGQSV